MVKTIVFVIIIIILLFSSHPKFIGQMIRAGGYVIGLPDFQSQNTGDFLQGVSVAASPVLAIVGKPSVRLSVCHTLALSENDAS